MMNLLKFCNRFVRQLLTKQATYQQKLQSFSFFVGAQSSALRSLYPQLPRKQGNPSPSQSNLARADVGNYALLHFLPDSFDMGKDSPGTDCRRGHLSYSFFQDIEIV